MIAQGNTRSIALVVMLGMMLLLSHSALALDGNYSGAYDGKTVSASFDNLQSTLTGIMVIGGERYMLEADPSGDGFSGQLHSLSTNEALNVRLNPSGGKVRVQINGRAKPLVFELKRDSAQ